MSLDQTMAQRHGGFDVRFLYHECTIVQTMDVILWQDTGIRFCDKAHLECERIMI
jgi:hypothetical protein